MSGNIYTLRLYDTELVKFVMENRGMEGLVVEVVSADESRRQLMPPGMELSDEGIYKWLRRRLLPRNRANVQNIMYALDTSRNDTKGIIDACKGLSLNDSYWVAPEGFGGSFADVNLYENRFSETVMLTAFTGELQGHDAGALSPEPTTNGTLPKAWRRIEDDGIYLYKGGSRNWLSTGQEPYCEYYASQIAEAMGLNAIRYDLEVWEGITASKCALFTDMDTAFIPAGRLIRSRYIKDYVDGYDALGPEFGEQLRSMFVFDALIFNEDRHFGNFGVLRDNHTGKIVAPAPLFDNGLSLLCNAKEEKFEDFEKLRAYAAIDSNPYQVSYERLCPLVMGEKQRVQLRRMLGFTFRRHPSINIPEEHLCMLEKLLALRVKELLAM